MVWIWKGTGEKSKSKTFDWKFLPRSDLVHWEAWKRRRRLHSDDSRSSLGSQRLCNWENLSKKSRAPAESAWCPSAKSETSYKARGGAKWTRSGPETPPPGLPGGDPWLCLLIFFYISILFMNNINIDFECKSSLLKNVINDIIITPEDIVKMTWTWPCDSFSYVMLTLD